jgi:hypothetical protein
VSNDPAPLLERLRRLGVIASHAEHRRHDGTEAEQPGTPEYPMADLTGRRQQHAQRSSEASTPLLDRIARVKAEKRRP